MGKPYRLTPAALRDLENIWRYGAAEWSAGQAEAYSKDLFAMFDFLSENPKAAKHRQEFSPPVRIYPCAAHMVVYREMIDHIEIVRLRHRSEDWSANPIGTNDQ